MSAVNLAGRLASISSKPNLRAFAQGFAQASVSPVADFIAPTIPVDTSVGLFEVYTERDRFRVLNQPRALRGKGYEITFATSTQQYNCTPYGADYPLDVLETMEEQQLENALMNGAQALSEIFTLQHESKVLSAAVAGVGASASMDTTNAATDCIGLIDSAITTVLLGGQTGNTSSVRVLFGTSAWRKVRNHVLTRSRFIVGSGANTPIDGAGLIAPKEEHFSGLLLGNPAVKVSYMVQDSSAEGAAKSMSFVLDNKVLVCVAQAQSRRDPSFMKTFRLNGMWAVPRTWMSPDQRVQYASLDWSEDIQITNAAAGYLFNVT